MFASATRWSFTSGTEKGDEAYQKMKPIWSAQEGFQSMSMYDITEGPNKGQRMTVDRFKAQKSLDTAREKITSDREKIIKSLEEKGVKMEENMQLEEVAGA
jgi:hypothetical protein